MALCCKDPAWIFVHIPRTSGTAIRLSVAQAEVPTFELCGKHATLGNVKTAAERRGEMDWYNSAYKFTVIRNPFAWAHSVWTWVNAFGRSGNGGNGALTQAILKVTSAEFAATFKVYRDQNIAQTAALVAPQSPVAANKLMFLHEYGGLDINDIFRQESIGDAWPVICERLGINVPLQRVGLVPRGSYHAIHTADTRKRAEATFAEDCKRYGYTFDSDDAGLSVK